jgi:hypothetical protein
MYDLWADDYVPVEECAQRLGISTARVKELVMARVLKASYERGYTLVQPALIAGVTTGPGACG